MFHYIGVCVRYFLTCSVFDVRLRERRPTLSMTESTGMERSGRERLIDDEVAEEGAVSLFIRGFHKCTKFGNIGIYANFVFPCICSFFLHSHRKL